MKYYKTYSEVKEYADKDGMDIIDFYMSEPAESFIYTDWEK